jgi:hypothetical protein
MKKIFSFIVLTFIVCLGFSQGIEYGIGAGVNCASLQSDQSFLNDFKYKVGFQINAVVGYHFDNKIGVRFEPGFANRGSGFNGTDMSDPKLNINYFTVPILIRYSLFDRFSILIGPECAFKLKATLTTDNQASYIEDFAYRKFDCGANVGISYRLVDNLELDLRYNRGFISTLIKDIEFYDENGDILEEARLYNQGFSVLLTYLIK